MQTSSSQPHTHKGHSHFEATEGCCCLLWSHSDGDLDIPAVNSPCPHIAKDTWDQRHNSSGRSRANS